MCKTIGYVLFFLSLTITPTYAAGAQSHHLIVANYSGHNGTAWVDGGYEITFLRFGRINTLGGGAALDIQFNGDNDRKYALEVERVAPLLTVSLFNITLQGSLDDQEPNRVLISIGASLAFDPTRDWDHRVFYGLRFSFR